MPPAAPKQENPRVHILGTLVVLFQYLDDSRESKVMRMQLCYLTGACRCPSEAHTDGNRPGRHSADDAQTVLIALGNFHLEIWVFSTRKPVKDLEASSEQMIQQCSARKTSLILENTQAPWQYKTLNEISHYLKSTTAVSK